MANPFSLSEIQKPRATTAAQNPFSLKSIGAGKRGALNLSVRQAVDTAPDNYAEARRLSKSFGQPVDLIERNLDESRKRFKLAGLAELHDKAPTLARKMLSPEFAKLSHDDVDALSDIEGIFKKHGFAQASKAQQIVEDLKPQKQESTETANARFKKETSTGQRVSARVQEGFLGLQQAIKSVPRVEAIDRGAQAKLEGDVLLGYDPLGLPITLAQVTPASKIEKQLKTFQEVGLATSIDLAKETAPFLKKKGELIQRPATVAMNNADTFSEGFDAFMVDPLGVLADIGISSGVQQLPALALTIATRNVGVAVAAAGGNSYALELGHGVADYVQEQTGEPLTEQSLRRALSDPKTASDAIRFAKARGSIIGAFDAASGGIASKAFFGKGFASELAGTFVAQPVLQGTLGGLGEATAQKVTTGEIRPGEVLAEALGELTTAPVEAIGFAANRLAQKRASAQQAIEDSEFLDSLSKLSSAAKLAGRSTEDFTSFVESSAEDGPVTDVYLDSDQLKNVLNQSGIEQSQLPKIIADQAAEIQAGGSIRIPVGEYAATVANTPLGEAIGPHLRVSPDGMSRAEADEFIEGMNVETQEAPALSLIKIKRPAVDENGEVTEVEESADVALSDVDRQIESIQGFIKCLAS